MKKQRLLSVRAVVAALLFLSHIYSQNAWLVGTYPGSHFVTLQEAIESPFVKPRDVLFVFAPRSSGPVTTSKPLTLLGLRGGGFPLLCPLTVRDIPRGEKFEIISGNALSHITGRDEYIHFEDCEGHIVLSAVGNIPTLPGPPSILLRNCKRVSINQSSLHEVAIINSVVSIARTHFDLIATSHGVPPLLLQDSTVTMAACTATTLPSSIGLRSPPTIAMTRGRLHIAGYGNPISTGGGVSQANYAIFSNGGEVVIDPDVRLNASGAHPPLGGSSRFTFEHLDFVRVLHKGPGQLVFPIAMGSPGDTASMFLGISVERPLTVPGLGELWMEPTLVWHLGTRTFGPLAEECFAALIPPTVPIGTALTFQLLTVTPGGVAKISMPSEVPVSPDPSGWLK